MASPGGPLPLVALAVLAYAAGLLLGFGGALFPALVVVAAALVVAANRRLTAIAGPALVLGAGAILAASVAREERRCIATGAAGHGPWRVRLGAPAAPGGMARGTLEGRCAVRAVLLVGEGRAAEGALVRARGVGVAGKGTLLIRDARVMQVAGPGIAARLRARASRAIGDVFGADAGMARALLIADVNGIPREARDRYAAAGLVHMLSISGLHVAIIAAAASLAFAALRLPRRGAELLSVLVTALYVLMIGAPAPAVRSGVMLGVGAASRLLQRPTSPWAALALGALVPLHDPRTVLDLGYQLSVGGMAALVAGGTLARRVSRLLPASMRGWRSRLLRDALISTVATVVSAPLVAWHFGRLSLIAPLSNLAAGPVVALLQPALFLGLLLAPVRPLARLVADGAHPLLLAFDAIASAAAALPGASLDVAPTLSAALLGGIAALALIAACAARFPEPPLIVLATCLAVLAWLPLIPPPPGPAELHMIDVGQGDAIALRTPRGRWLLFDAGRGWRGGDAGRTTILPYLRRRGGELGAFILSHPHADHVGGAASVLRALRPHVFWDAGYAAGGEAYAAALVAARQRGIEWRRVRPGERLLIDGVELRFLAPDSAWAAGLDDPNEASTVALVTVGAVRFLLTGDAERDEEAWLIAHAGDALRADVLKVGHHGSRTSSGAMLLEAVRPRLALISVGAGNRYGHPSPEVLRALRTIGAEVLRTDQAGDIIVRTNGRTIEIETTEAEWELSRALPDGSGAP